MLEGAPIIEGLTQTAQEAAPLYLRLADVMAQRPGGSGRKLADAIALLEQAAGEESDQRVRGRITAGISMIRGDVQSGDDQG